MLRLRGFLAGSLLLLLLTPLAFAFEVPANDGFYTETIDILSDEEEATLEQRLTEYERQTSNEVAILLVESMSGSDIIEEGTAVLRQWRVGKEDKNNGALIFAAVADREAAIVTGYGLEGAVPDIVAKGIGEQEMGPYFAKGRYYDGLIAGVEALEKHIGGEYTAERYTDEGGGLGEVVFVLIFIVLNFFGSFMARSKSWWLGGVMGGAIGIILTIINGWWISIPFFIILGLVFDYLVSRNPPGGGMGGRYGGWGSGLRNSGRSTGGFRGFGGGSGGGGGARFKW